MNYCISLIQGNHDSLKKEILEEISQLQNTAAKKPDSKKIQKKIDSLEMKKRKAIDLMLDGLISKDDLQNQTAWYNEEIENLNKQLADALQKDKSDFRQINNMEQYMNALNEILGMDGNSEEVYKEVLDHMEIHKGNIVDVWLKSIPVGIRLNIRATGKREYFKTEIIKHEFLAK